MQLCTGTGAFGSGRHDSGGPRGTFGPCPPKGQSPGTTIYHNFLPSKPKPGLLDPLGPLAKVDFLSGFRALRDGSGPRRKNQGSTEGTRAPRDGPARRIRAPQDRSGPVGRIRAPQDRSVPVGRIRAPQDRSFRARKTNKGPAGQIRDHGTDQGLAIRIGAPQDGSGPRTSNQGPNDQSGLRKTDQGPAGQAGSRETDEGRQDEVGPRRTNRVPVDEAEPRKTNQAPTGRIRDSVRKLFSRSKFTEQILTPQTEQNFYLRAQVILLLRVAERFM